MLVLYYYPHEVEAENPSTRLLFVNTRKKNPDSSDANDGLWWIFAEQASNRFTVHIFT